MSACFDRVAVPQLQNPAIRRSAGEVAGAGVSLAVWSLGVGWAAVFVAP